LFSAATVSQASEYRSRCHAPIVQLRTATDGLSGGGFFSSARLAGDDLAENLVEGDGDTPVGVVGLELGEVGDVADVVADAVLVDILPVHCFAGHFCDLGDGFEDGNAVFAAAAEVVDLAGARIGGKLFDGADDIVAVDVVAHLLALVADDRIRAAPLS